MNGFGPEEQQIQKLHEEVARLKKCEEFVEEFVKYGFRLDVMPTRAWPSDNSVVVYAMAEEYDWWSKYITGAEKRMQAVARKALE